MNKKIRIVEVGARDGLQYEARIFSVAEKVTLIKKLLATGVQTIEVGAFVSSKKIPAMASTFEVVKKLEKNWPKAVKATALVPNLQGLQRAQQTHLSGIAVFGSCSEAFSQKNINASILESFKKFKEVLDQSKKLKKRGYLSMVWGCPYEGAVSQAKVISLTKKMFDMGVDEVSLGDTIGVANPKTVESLLKKMKSKSIPMDKVFLHFHDTKGLALANVAEGLRQGITGFDSSVGGLGGCPYAVGSAGNISTEGLVYMLHQMGYKTGVDLEQVIKTAKWLEKKGAKISSSHI